MNISTVQSIDRKAEHILGRVSQVMHYVFNKSERTWDDNDVKGTLFIYERSKDPKYAFVILNTQTAKQDLKVPMDSDMQFQMYYPLLMYRSVQHDISALYIQEKPDFYKTGEMLSNLVGFLRPEVHKTIQPMPEHNLIASSLFEGKHDSSFGSAGFIAPGSPRNSCRIQNLDTSELSESNMKGFKDPYDIEVSISECENVDIVALLTKAQTEYETKVNDLLDKGASNNSMYRTHQTYMQPNDFPINTKSQPISVEQSIDKVLDKSSIKTMKSPNHFLREFNKMSSPKKITNNLDYENENTPPGDNLLNASTISHGSPVQKLLPPDMFENNSTNITMLTKSQLQSALIDLIKNDDDFFTKIHNSYIDKVSKKF